MKDFFGRVGFEISDFGRKIHTAGWALAFVLLLTAGLRYWGVSFGLPYVYHPDEPVAVHLGLGVLHTGDYNPHFFHYPTAYYYLVTGGLVIYFLLGASRGIFGSVTDVAFPRIFVLGSGLADFPGEFMVARLITLALGVCTVGLVFWVARRHWGTRAGVLAALLLALSSVHVAHSRFATADVPVTFAVTLSAVLSLEFIRSGRYRYYGWGCLVGGLAISTKYNAVYIIAILIVCSYVTESVRKQNWWQPKFLAAAMLCPLGFLIGTPYAFLSLPEFLNGVAFDLNHYAQGHAGMEGNTLSWYLEFLFRQEGVVPLLALAGGVYCILKRRIVGLVVFLVAILYFAIVSRFIVRNGRTILLIFPFMALLAGVVLDVVLGYWQDWLGSKKRHVWYVTSVVLIGLVLIWPVRNIVKTGRSLVAQDVRTTALEWIRVNLPPGDKLAVESYGPPLDPAVFNVVYTDLISQPHEWFEQEGFDFIVMSSGAYGRFFADPGRYPDQIAKYEALSDHYSLLQTFQGPLMGYPQEEIKVLAVTRP